MYLYFDSYSFVFGGRKDGITEPGLTQMDGCRFPGVITAAALTLYLGLLLFL